MNEEKKVFDESAPQRYLDHLRNIDMPTEQNILDLFKGNQSQDFYLGMLAGIKGYISILTSMELPESFFDGLMHISIDLQKCIVQQIKP